MTWCAFCGHLEEFNSHQTESPCKITNADEPCNACAELTELEYKIAKAKETLLQMQSEHHELKSKINNHHDQLIYRLPLEISSEIFQLCLPDDILEDDLQARWSRALCAPLLLSAICRSWRIITHSTPRLWTAVPIRFLVEQRVCWLPQLAQEWLSRSHPLPLSININIESAPHNFVRPFEPVIDVLNQHLYRLRYLQFKGPAFLLARLSCGAQGAPDLRTLKLYPYSSRGSTKILKFGDVKPKPTTLEIMELRLRQVDIEWDSLTHANADGLCIGECLELIKRASCMTRCILANIKPGNGRFPLPDQPLLRSVLQNLEVNGDDDSVHNIMSCLTLPSLNSYTSDMGDFPAPLDTLSTLFQRSSCPLESLCFRNVLIHNHQGVLDLLRDVPSLHNLTFELSQETYSPIAGLFLDCVLRGFEFRPENLLPSIQSLQVFGPIGLWWHEVLNLSPSHSTKVHPNLRSIVLGIYPSGNDENMLLDEDISRRFLPMLETGTAIKVLDLCTRRDVLEESLKTYRLARNESQTKYVNL